MINVRQVTAQDIHLVAPLFDAYRQFYGQSSDIHLARSFLTERIHRQESVVLLAEQAAAVVGFTQLYPSFSSTRAVRTYILNDLYVAPENRRAGIAKLLLLEAARFGRAAGVSSLSLSTAHTNTPAQMLYASLGWVLDDKFRTYSLRLGA